MEISRHTSPNEVQSCKNSMMPMYTVINILHIPDTSNIAIEYQIPLTWKRIDFIIAGLDEKKENIIIIELKQWEQAKLSNKSGIVKTRFQHGESETAHPSYQAWSYAYILFNYNESVREQQIILSIILSTINTVGKLEGLITSYVSILSSTINTLLK